jgi:hypothetical protein
MRSGDKRAWRRFEAPQRRRPIFSRDLPLTDRVGGELSNRRRYDRMGSASSMCAWLILRQTPHQGETGCVLGGSPVTYREIENDKGFDSQTLVTKAKKSTRFPQGGRKTAETYQEVAEWGKQARAASLANSYWNQELAGPIGSSSVERSIAEKDEKRVFHRDFHSLSKNFAPTPEPSNLHSPRVENQSDNSSALPSSTPWNPSGWEQLKYFVEARRQFLRAERDEETRREVAVEKAPEVRPR